MVTGVIYLYTSPSGKHYVGQTINEPHRRSTWFCEKRYAGRSINKARAKYGPYAFKYDILFRKTYNSRQEALEELNIMEAYFIGFYDSYRNGYNNTFGGLSSYGSKHDVRYKKTPNVAVVGQHWSITDAIKYREDEIKKNRSKRASGKLKKVGQYSIDGKLIRVWSCLSEASEAMNCSVQNIKRAIDGHKSAKGFMWCIYEGKDTIEPYTMWRGNHYDKEVEQYDKAMRLLAIYPTITAAAKTIGKSAWNISNCLNGKTKEAYGFIWKFK